MQTKQTRPTVLATAIAGATLAASLAAGAVPVPGGTLDPLIIPKYVTPLVIPPVMKDSACLGGAAGMTCANTNNDYNIAVRQFKQQILPAGFPATTVWSYGPEQDPTPAVAPDPNSQFNYPAYTIETTSNVPVAIDWINDLVAGPDACKASLTPATDPACNFIPHLLPIDRTLHWANPELLTCSDGTVRTDCRPGAVNGAILQQPYAGPVPIVTHVHGAHVNPDSDGYPEEWWLPNANNIPAGYATQGKLVNGYPRATHTAARPGVGQFVYRNDQPSTTLWYHDHTLGMTRSNVYAGPAGFWLVRDTGGTETGLVSGTLPGPAPVAGDTVLELNAPAAVPGTVDKRSGIREIPVVIQDRSFNADGSLFYPNNRAFFEGVNQNKLKIPFIGDPAGTPSDISPIWNPEAFFNVMVVNGVAWPNLEVAQAEYRLRLLNGSNSRFLNLSLFVVDPVTGLTTATEVPMYQIGAEQSLMPKVVEVRTGFKTVLPGDGTIPAPTPATAPEEALLMGLAERADVIVDFSGLAPGTRVRMINTGPDAPFGGFPAVPLADPATSGQVMEFVVNAALNGASPTDPTGATPATAPESLVLSLPDQADPALGGVQATVRDQALLEEESILVCATIRPNGVVSYDRNATPDPLTPGTCIDKKGRLATSVPFAPKAAVLGNNGAIGGTPTLWADPIVTNPASGSTETWELWNWTVDAHPIHLHLVKFKVLERQVFDPLTGTLGPARAPEVTEDGWKDTVIAYPGEVTRLNATFDIDGLYVWHCHIVEHEDNEMMVPFCVGDPNANGCAGL